MGESHLITYDGFWSLVIQEAYTAAHTLLLAGDKRAAEILKSYFLRVEQLLPPDTVCTLQLASLDKAVLSTMKTLPNLIHSPGPDLGMGQVGSGPWQHISKGAKIKFTKQIFWEWKMTLRLLKKCSETGVSYMCACTNCTEYS